MEKEVLAAISGLTDSINRGDMTSMTAFFEPEAVLVVQALAGQPGQVARGVHAIGEAYRGFFAMKPRLRRHAQEVVEAGGVALHYSRWTLTATAPDGTTLERTGISTDVVRRQPDGRWLVSIYNPYGIALLG